MAEYNTGITAPAERVKTVTAPTLFQEQGVVMAPLDWTLQENDIFAQVATELIPVLDKWKELEQNAKELENEKVVNTYKKTLAEFETNYEWDLNDQTWRAKLEPPPPQTQKPRAVNPRWDADPNIQKSVDELIQEAIEEAIRQMLGGVQ